MHFYSILQIDPTVKIQILDTRLWIHFLEFYMLYSVSCDLSSISVSTGYDGHKAAQDRSRSAQDSPR